MKSSFTMGAIALALVFTSSVSAKDDDPIKQAIEYRQSAMTLVGANFKPMGAMLKGKIPYDEAQFARFARDLGAVSSLDILRGFVPDSDGEGSEAKGEIWLRWDDFEEQMNNFKEAAAKLSEVAQSDDKDAIAKQFGVTGKTCKSCHDDFKE